MSLGVSVKPNQKFKNKNLKFWANIKALSEKIGYTKRGFESVLSFTEDQIRFSISNLGLKRENYFNKEGSPTNLTSDIIKYSKYRANILNNNVAKNLLDKNSAEELFQKLKKEQISLNCPIPMNKQKGAKKSEAYFTGMVNILIESNTEGYKVDYDPKKLIKIFKKGSLKYTLSRRFDGAFPSIINPIAVWEIKEYYNTTTFGSRVADGVYETQLDGFELEEMNLSTRLNVQHYLFVDGYSTYWLQGRSYLCRIIDMMHTGKVDEVIFGKEIIKAIPLICKRWLNIIKRQ